MKVKSVGLLTLTILIRGVKGFTLPRTTPKFRGSDVPLVVRPQQRTNKAMRGGDITIPVTISSSRLQAIPIEVATCLLPTCGGYISREFGVSYAYGAATSLTAWFVLQRQILATASSWNWAAWHASAVVFYGIRLSLFLFFRQQTSTRIKEMQKRIEERAESSGNLLSRTPFVLSCAYLYYGLCAPLYLTAAVASQPLGKLELLFKGLVASTWFGFLVAALGDFTKSFVKGRKGEDHLVTGGIFGFLRHPNYTGEMIGWTSSALAGLVAFVSLNQFTKPKLWFYLASNLMGAMGINFVLLLAARNLEKKQAEKYGGEASYKDWISSSWAGFTLPQAGTTTTADPHLEVSDVQEDEGSGI